MKARAFTLIELLVAISIMVILAALLLSYLSRVKQKGQGVYCLNNLKQIQYAWHLYSADHGERLPPVDDTEKAGKDAKHPSWVTGWLRLDGDPGDKTESTNSDLLVGSAYAQFGSIGRYVNQAGSYRCPGDRSTVRIGGVSFSRVRSVSINAYLGGAGKWQAPGFQVFKTTGQIQRPADIWVFMDEREDSINDGAFGVDMTKHYAIVDYPASYHNGANGISFADGHAEIHHWRESTTMPSLQREHLPYDSKPTSDHDVDMSWLTLHTTVSKSN